VPVTEVEPVAVCDDAAVPLLLAVCDGDAPTDNDAELVPLLVAAAVVEPLDDSDAVRLADAVPVWDADAGPVCEPEDVPVTEAEPVSVRDDESVDVDVTVPLPLAVCDGDAPTDSDAELVPLLDAVRL
jgi:hypothetical protein